MIYLFHGESQVQSRQALDKLRRGFGPTAITVLDEFSPSELVEACEARALFSEKRLVVVEIRDRGLKSWDQRLLDYLEKAPESTCVVFWFAGKLKKSDPLLKKVKSLGDVRYFGAPPEKPFPLLDALGERSAKRAYLELRKLLSEGQSEFYILRMIAWKITNLLQVKSGVGKENLHPYVYRKAKGQSAYFSEEELVEKFGKVLEGDLEMKTGGDPRLVLDRLVYEITQNAKLKAQSHSVKLKTNSSFKI